MKITRLITASALFLLTLVGTVAAQTATTTLPTQWPTQWIAAKRQVLAVKYNENKQTTVIMSGTAIAPRVTGKADVEFKQGRTNVRLEMGSFANPQSLGAFYTCYVLWAVAPEGQAENLMELPIQKNFKIESTAKFQTFGLIITAEPHSRVELPSSMIVAENTLGKATTGALTTSKIEYSGDPGTFYAIFLPNAPAANPDYTTPLLILGARRAVEIAQRADAKRFAEVELRDAETKLATLEQAWPRSRKPSDLRDNAKKNSGLAHDVMRIAEQARKLSVERSDQARLDAERQQAGNNIAQAQSEAERARNAAARATMNAERARAEAGSARTDAERAKTEAERARTDAGSARTEAERAKMEAERAQSAEREGTARAANEAALARERVAQAQSETEKAKANEGLARNDADSARLQTAAAQRERDAAQQSLYVSLSAVLETRRDARGLIVNLSDVLFDTGKATLKPGAREKLSKLSGILLAYPGAYQIEIEGHTDSVGSEESNLNLSRGRAEAVRDYLTQNGIKSERIIAARGFGEANPVADNNTAAGRQVNRRVEIVIADQPQAQAKAGNQ
ncbi:MAG: OmpA family protein [Acidobacteria bacterium]|nr:OmpA family protein [Acidobacteriota bacterium]MBI3428158.1 OmpA family protein [Acidobacteriota bacterium]